MIEWLLLIVIATCVSIPIVHAHFSRVRYNCSSYSPNITFLLCGILKDISKTRNRMVIFKTQPVFYLCSAVDRARVQTTRVGDQCSVAQQLYFLHVYYYTDKLATKHFNI